MLIYIIFEGLARNKLTNRFSHLTVLAGVSFVNFLEIFLYIFWGEGTRKNCR